jgi:hypothetical protein
MYQNIPTKVLTGEVRLSYANLTTPRANKPGDKEKYSVTLLIPKSDTATKANIDASAEAAAQEAQGKLWNGVRPPVLPVPIHDGDGVRENGTPFGPECKGHWVMTASTYNRPQVVHQSDVNTELAPQDIYSGMYARVTINFFGYLNNGKKGVGCGLGNVMKTRDGEPLAGGASASADFADVGNTVAAPAPQYPQYAPPAQPTYPQQPAAPTYPQQPPAAPAYGGVPAGASPINPLTGLPY